MNILLHQSRQSVNLLTVIVQIVLVIDQLLHQCRPCPRCQAPAIEEHQVEQEDEDVNEVCNIGAFYHLLDTDL